MTDSAGRRVVLVSGPPAAGKSAIAGPLAVELGFMLIAKDTIKETLHDALGLPAEADVDSSQRLGAAAMELLWVLTGEAPAVVLDANFWPDEPRHEARLRALNTVPVEVHCQCPVSDCMRRYAERAPSRHPVHADSARRVVAETFMRSARPLALGPVITVDTTRPVDVQAVAADVRRVLCVRPPLASRGDEPVPA